VEMPRGGKRPRAVYVHSPLWPARQRQAVTMVYLQQLSEEEVALRWGPPKAAVRSLLSVGWTTCVRLWEACHTI